MRLTHIGGPTALIEVAGWRILTDPTFDPPGRRYRFGWGTSSRKTAGPAMTREEVGSIDLVLLSHDHHADNLDDAGRRHLPSASQVVTTVAGAKRLRLAHARGLKPGCSTVVTKPGCPDMRVTATVASHGPRWSRPIVGAVVGFLIEVGGNQPSTIWMTGDTVLTSAVMATARALDVDVLLLHLGRVRFRATGRLRYSLGGREALRLVRELDPAVIVPVHYEGWSHFSESISDLAVTFASAPEALRKKVVWLKLGVPETVWTSRGGPSEDG